MSIYKILKFIFKGREYEVLDKEPETLSPDDLQQLVETAYPNND